MSFGFTPNFTEAKPEITLARWDGHGETGVPYIASQWTDNGEDYLCVVSYNPHRDATFKQWNKVRNRWEDMDVPSGLDAVIQCYLDIVLLLPMELP